MVTNVCTVLVIRQTSMVTNVCTVLVIRQTGMVTCVYCVTFQSIFLPCALRDRMGKGEGNCLVFHSI